MAMFNVGGRELALAFTIGAMDEMEKALERPINLEDIKETVIEMSKDRRKLLRLISILANEGETLEGRASDVDEKWLSRHMKPGALPRAQVAVFEAVTEGMRMEAAEANEDEEVDLVLEELKKKQTPGA